MSYPDDSGFADDLKRIYQELLELRRYQETILQRQLEFGQLLDSLAQKGASRVPISRSLGGDSPFLTSAEAAKLANRSADSIRRWMREGKLSDHRPLKGGPLLISRAELIDLLENEPRPQIPDDLAA